MMYQQGDVLFTKVKNIPQGQVQQNGVVAEGEATGHCHAVCEGARVIIADNGKRYVSVFGEETEVVHQEHHTITLPKGNYQIGIIQEYDHFMEEAHQVAD